MRVVGNICIHTDIALSSNQPLIIECWFAERDLQSPCTNVHQIQSQQVTGTTNSTVSPVPRSHLSLSANQPQIIWIICTRRPAISLHTRLTSCTSSLTQQSNRTPCNCIAFMHTECRDNKSYYNSTVQLSQVFPYLKVKEIESMVQAQLQERNR